MPSCDAIVIGGGTNGLACAFRLQKSGRKVLLLESHDAVGGAATARGSKLELPLAHLVNKLDHRIETAMNLEGHGLQWHHVNLPTVALSETGCHLTLSGAAGEALSGDGAAGEQPAWTELRARLMRYASLLAPFKEMPPPRLSRHGKNNWLALAQAGLKLRMMGKSEMREFMRLLLINVHDVLEDELTHPLLKGVLAFDSTLGSWLGPRSPNSLILLLDRLAGQVGGTQAALALPAGGVANVANAMAGAARAAGVEIRTGASVARILVDNDRAAGVALASGEDIKAAVVVSAISPKATFLSLVGHGDLDTGFRNRIRHQKSRGAAAKLHLRLKSQPSFRGADLASRLVIAPSSEAVERAYNPVKYGEVPEAPVMEIILPSVFAGDGHTLSAIVQYAPHVPVAGREKARRTMLANALAQLERHSPGIGKSVSEAELLMPYDVAERYGMVGGNWHHGELSVEQMLFLRPVPGTARHATPLDGLWLASAGCHPGGGISGAAGWNAAGAIMGAAA
jgi:phytoene dehydrogenase-like protein